MSELEQFIKEGSQMMVKLPAMRQLEAKISAIKSWKDRLADIFHLSSPNAVLTLVCAFDVFLSYAQFLHLQEVDAVFPVLI